MVTGYIKRESARVESETDTRVRKALRLRYSFLNSSLSLGCLPRITYLLQDKREEEVDENAG